MSSLSTWPHSQRVTPVISCLPAALPAMRFCPPGSGSASKRITRCFRSAATRVFFEGIRDEFDLVFIDTPPLLHVAYTSIISRYADGALIVVNHGGAVSELEEVADRLEFIGTKPIGYVYNRSPLRSDQTEIEGSLKDILGAGTPNGKSAGNSEPKKGRFTRKAKQPS